MLEISHRFFSKSGSHEARSVCASCKHDGHKQNVLTFVEWVLGLLACQGRFPLSELDRISFIANES